MNFARKFRVRAPGLLATLVRLRLLAAIAATVLSVTTANAQQMMLSETDIFAL